MTKWFYQIYKMTEVIIDTKPNYKIDNLPERYNEALLKWKELTLKGKKTVMWRKN